MSRFLLSAVLCSVVFGCSVDEDLSSYVDRNPALKTLQFGFQYDLYKPSGLDNRSYQHDLATGREHAFVGVSDRHCAMVSVYALADAEAGVRAPSQVFSTCDEEAYGGEQFAKRLDTRGDLLVAGTHVFRIGTEVTYEADLAAALRPGLVITENLVMDEDEVALASADTVFIVQKQGNDWFEVDRVPRQGTALHYDNDVLAVDKIVYHRDSDGVFVETHTFSRQVSDVRDSRVLTEPSYRLRVYDWDGDAYSRPSTTSAQGHSGQLTRDGAAHTNGRGDLIVYDSDLNEVSRDNIIDGTNSGFMHVQIQHDRAIAQWRGKVAWLHLVGHDPVEGDVLRASASVGQREEHHESFEVPVGARSLTVVLSGTGDGDLYVRAGAAPSGSAFDCSPYRFGSDEVCTFTDPTPGTWYAAVHGFEDVSDVVMVATVD